MVCLTAFPTVFSKAHLCKSKAFVSDVKPPMEIQNPEKASTNYTKTGCVTVSFRVFEVRGGGGVFCFFNEIEFVVFYCKVLSLGCLQVFLSYCYFS